MSYDLNLTASGALDLDVARVALGGDLNSDEAVWLRDGLSASILFTDEEIDIGVSGDDVPAATRARDFEELLRTVMDLASRLGAAVYDPQLGREIGVDDIPEAVEGFA